MQSGRVVHLLTSSYYSLVFRTAISMSIYVLPVSKPQIRRLYFRNLSTTDIVVKLISTKPKVLELARNRLRLEPQSYLFIEAKFLYTNLGAFDYIPPKLIGYAMPVYSHTLPIIGKWLNTEGMETSRQLAFEMQVLFSSTVFSARDIIIDLPGTACLVESVSRPVPSSNGDSPVDEADADTKTAVTFCMNKDVVCNIREEKGTKANNSCWLADLITSHYTAITAGITNESRVETRTRSSLRTAKRQPSSTTTNFSSLMPVESGHVNVEQEATPCGGAQ